MYMFQMSSLLLALTLFTANGYGDCVKTYQVKAMWGKFMGSWVLLPHPSNQKFVTCKRDWTFNVTTGRVWYQRYREYRLECVKYRGKLTATLRPMYLSTDVYYLENSRRSKMTCNLQGRHNK